MTPEQRTEAIALCRDRWTPTEVSEKLGVSYQSVYGLAVRAGVALAKNWSRRYRQCVVCGTTKCNHRGKGVCTGCAERRRLADPVKAERTRLKSKAWKQANPDRTAGYVQRWRKKNPQRKKASDRMQARVRRARGFDQVFVRGVPVQVPWASDYEGAPTTLRVIKRYALEGDAFVDLKDGKKVYTQVPMSSLTLVAEIGSKYP